MNTIKDVINLYKPKMKELGMTPIPDFYKLNRQLENEIKKIINAENEILEYFQKAIMTCNWEEERYWAIAAITHPSSIYLDTFFKILETNNTSYPHWRILDVLAWLPEDLYCRITKELKKVIELGNSSWREEELKKAFEVLIWIGKEEDIIFIEQQCKSENKKIAKMAEYWIDWLKEED